MVKAGKRNLIVDTGFNREECMSAMHSGLKEIGVDLRGTDFLLTHLHAEGKGKIRKDLIDQKMVFTLKQTG